MKRTTKKVLSLLVSAAMAFSLGTAAFAEQATPETAAAVQSAGQTLRAAAFQVQSNEPDTQNDVTETVATFSVGTSTGGETNLTTSVGYASLTEAFTAAKEYAQNNYASLEADRNAGKTVIFEIRMEKDQAESFWVPDMPWGVSFYLNGHTLTATNKHYAIALAENAKLTVMDGSVDSTGKIVNNIATDAGCGIFTLESGSAWYNLYILGGTYDSTNAVFLYGMGENINPDARISIAAGKFLNDAVPDESLIESGKELVNRDGVWTVQEKVEGVAALTGMFDGAWTTKNCDTLQEALTTAASMTGYAQIKLVKDVKESVTVDHVSGHGIQLNLNGHTITADGTDAPALHVGSDFSEAFLSVVDGYDGNGGICGGQQPAIQIDTVTQTSPSLTIGGGVYTSDAAPVVVNYGKAQLMGGTFTGASGQPVVENHSVQYTTTNNGYVYLGGATFRAADDGYLFRSIVDDDGARGNLWCNTTSGPYGEGAPGQFYGNIGDEASLLGVLQVKSAKFEHKLNEQFLAPGCEQTEEDGMYVVRYAGPVAEAGGNTYDYVSAAINANAGTVKLLRDAVEEDYIPEDMTVTIDLNGHTVTQSKNGRQDVGFINNGTLTLRGNGALVGSFAMYNDNAVTYLESRDQLQGDLAEGTAFMKDKENGLYVLRTYNFAVARVLNEYLAKADAAVKSFYGSNQQLAALTAEQVKAARKMSDSEKQQIADAYLNLTAQNQADMQRVLATEKYAALADSYRMVADLYAACNSMELDTENKNVASAVDASKAQVPATDATVPADKQPTAADAKKAVEKIVGEVTTNSTVNNFKDNGLTQVVDLTTIPDVGAASKLTFSVQVALQSVELDAEVVKNAAGTVTEVKLPGKTLVFNVEPMISVDGGAARKLENSQLNGGAVTVRLPIPKDVTDKYAKVAHAGDADRYLTIYTAENGDKYIEFTTTHFSNFVVTFTNELPKAAAAEQTTAAPAQTPAPKQDDSAYYTCKACGYHDWTAVDGGYKCDHCGYVESVKQIAGYPNVKGTATVGKAAAAKANTAKTMSAIPQTSDDMPVTALVVIAIAALLGLGVTAALKRKQN